MSETDNENLVRVENTTSRVLGLPQIDPYLPKLLQPGFNNVPEGHIAALDRNAVVRDWYDKGMIAIHDSGEDQPEGPIAPKSLAEYGAPAAVKLAALESDVDILRRWRRHETRATVKKALDARISEVTGISIDDEDEEDDSSEA